MEKKLNCRLIKAHKTLINCRRGFTVVLIINFIIHIERTTFDFMGFMFGMIIADLIFLFFLITGLFGAYQYRVNYIASLILASVFWIAWNLFVICVYLNVGSLDSRNPNILNMNTNKTSWFYLNNVGCLNNDDPISLASYPNEQFRAMPELNTQMTSNIETVANTKDQLTVLRHLKSTKMPSIARQMEDLGVDPSDILATTIGGSFSKHEQRTCFIPYYLAEIIHSGILIFMSVLCIIFGLLLSNALKDEILTNCGRSSDEALEAMDRVTIVTNTNEPSSLEATQSRSETFKFDPCYIYGGAGGVLGTGTKF